MNWQAVSVATKNEAIEAVADILLQAGAQGVQINDHDAISVTAYYPDDEQLGETITAIQKALKHLSDIGMSVAPATITVNGIQQKDWEDNWKAYYHAERVTRHFTVVPSWETYHPNQIDELPIIMDPKLAFGTGTHETTRLMLQALENVVRGGESMIDVGTGSGVLAVAAKQLGVAHVLATDIDEMSVNVAKENLRLNPVAQDVTVVASDLLADVVISPVDLIVANILADVIERLIPQTTTLLKPGGLFLVSGIYDNIALHIEDVLRANDYTIVQKSQMGEWHGYIVQLKEKN